jgi:release factor glutamine methyltransferase
MNVGSPARDASTDDRPLELARIVSTLRAAGCVFAEAEAELLLEATRSPAELVDLVTRRAAGEPLEHVVGWAGFHGLRLAVGPGVFVPRRRTEFVVDQAIALIRPGAVVLDLCCGCGAVGAAVRAAAEGIELHAVDVDPAAVRYARRNLPGAHVHRGDLFQPLPAAVRGRVDLLTVIAPYVPTGSIRLMPPEAREHEPSATLDGGPDGLDVLRRVLAEAVHWLAPGGHLLTETGTDQVRAATTAITRAGLTAGAATDEEGNTVLIGAKPHP